MKIRCSCGTKYEFDVTPEMARNPVRFVCSSCGLDSSEYVNQLVREELAEKFPEEILKPPPAAPRLKIAHEEKPAEPPPSAAPVSKYCAKHRGVLATARCTICGKPICPQCMALFGYFCSPLCKNKAELQGVAAPVYAGQKSQVEARFWRKVRLIFGLSAAVVGLFLGAWIWYAWFGSVPHPYFSVRFADDDRAYAGASQIVGKDQIIFLHGGTLARYDLKTKKQIWSQELITPDQIAAIVKADNDELARERAAGEIPDNPLPGTQERQAKIALQSGLSLRVLGQNIWVSKIIELPPAAPDAFPEFACQLTHYDWETGRVLQEVTIPESRGEMIEGDNELLVLAHTPVGAQFVTHVSLENGEQRTEEFHDPGATFAISTSGAPRANVAATGGLPLSPGADSRKPLDPNKVAEQAQNLKLPARIALPALLANASHEQQLEAALREDDSQKPKASAQKKRIAENFRLIPSKNGYVQFAWHLLEEKTITREAMQAAPAKSALDDASLNVTKTAEVANEMLNEMQRNNGGSTVTEDVSRYQVSIRRTDSPELVDWTGEVVGPPALFPLKTVNVLTAGKTATVFDKSNKKLWEASLTYNVSGGGDEFDPQTTIFGAGPCVEHGDTLYVFDEAVLTAFDLATGNARWRVPSVGIVGLFFDDQGMVYVNTTTASLNDIRYSRQIDITKSTAAVVSKIDPKTGKILWSVKPGGFISYLSGKFIYTVVSYDPNPTDEEVLSDTLQGLEKPAYLRIARINPNDGRVMWEHEQDRCPIDVRFNGNSIELIFKREVQVLKYLSL